MNPNRAQIEQWADLSQVDETGYVRLPFAAWDGLLFVLALAERAEDVAAAARPLADQLERELEAIHVCPVCAEDQVRDLPAFHDDECTLAALNQALLALALEAADRKLGGGPMGPGHPRWKEFVDRLEGPEGCDFHEAVPGDESTITWRCGGGNDKTRARAILLDMGFGEEAVRQSLALFEARGGHCDCEILFNVAGDEGGTRSGTQSTPDDANGDDRGNG